MPSPHREDRDGRALGQVVRRRPIASTLLVSCSVEGERHGQGRQEPVGGGRDARLDRRIVVGLIGISRQTKLRALGLHLAHTVDSGPAPSTDALDNIIGSCGAAGSRNLRG